MLAWARTLRCATWFLPLVHVGYPSLARWSPWSGVMRLPEPVRWAGRGLAASGAVLTLWSVVWLVREGNGTPAPYDPPRRFVGGGPYCFCRNPMELGNLLTQLGRGIAAETPRLLLASLLFGASMHGWVVLVEEPSLARRFGEPYGCYRRSVPRWGWRGQA